MRIGGAIEQRNGMQQYAAQTALREPVELSSNQSESGERSGQAATNKETVFGFKLGKFSIELATEHPDVDPQEMASLALERFQRAQASSFESEIEIAQLRAELSAPAEALSNVEEQTQSLDPRSAANAYAKADQALRSTTARPGVLIGVA